MDRPPQENALFEDLDVIARSVRSSTLPPPEWSAPLTSHLPPSSLVPLPLARNLLRRGEEARLRARVAAARERPEKQGSRRAYVELARWLSAHERELDTATQLLELAISEGTEGDSSELRRELAAWLESQGEHARAADTLRPLLASPQPDEEGALIRERILGLEVRAGLIPMPGREGGAQELALAFGRRGASLALFRDELRDALSLAVPIEEFSAPFAAALTELSFADSELAALVARRALDVLGAKNTPLREAFLLCASRANDTRFTVSVVERWVSAEPKGEGRRGALVQLSKLFAALGDADEEAWALVRAVSEGAWPENIAERIDVLSRRSLSADGEIALALARAEWAASSSAPADETAAYFRALGAALWDMAEDREGAVRAWIRAARLSPENGYATLGVDLLHFADARYALDQLTVLADAESEPKLSGLAAAEAARAALSMGEPEKAFTFASTALEKSPTHASALELAEIAADQSRSYDQLSALYDRIAATALGRFGRRAAHFRAARHFEQSGRADLCLKHAAESFLAVPSDGTAFTTLARAAARAGDPAFGVRTIEQVADAARDPGQRAAWLVRATTLLSHDDDGEQQRLDLLLRALRADPSLGAIEQVYASVASWLAKSPDERDALEFRIDRVSQAIASDLEGPTGARIAIALAKLMLRLFQEGRGALRVVELAMALDADVDDFLELRAFVPELSAAEASESFVERMCAAAEGPNTNFGAPAMNLIRLIAERLGLTSVSTRALILQAMRDQDDDEIVALADLALSEGASASARESFERRVRPTRVREALTTVANARWQAANRGLARSLFERAAALASGVERVAIEVSLVRLAEEEGRGKEADERLQSLANAVIEPPDVRALYWDLLAKLRDGRGDVVGATAALLAGLAAGSTAARYEALKQVVVRISDPYLRSDALRVLASLSSGSSKRRFVLERADLLERSLRNYDEAANELGALLGEYPADAELLLRLGDLFANQGKVGEAERAWRRAVQRTTESTMLRALDDRLTALSDRSSPKSSGKLRARAAEQAPKAAVATAIEDESRFWEALSRGEDAAGDEIVRRVRASGGAEGTEVILRVRRIQADLVPGDDRRLRELHEAALADHDTKQARAVEHVLRTTEPGERSLLSPSLYSQTRQPDLLSLISRPSVGPWFDVLTLVWEGAPHLFARDAGAYGITGIERIAPGGASAAARIYEGAVLLLDLPQIALFLLRGHGPIAASPAVLAPPGVVISGDVRDDTGLLKFVIGNGLSSALSQHLLLLGLPTPEGRAVFRALMGAFGPPEMGRTLDPHASALAERFWSLLPSRTQRKLCELLVSEREADYDRVVERARQTGRRLGLFLSGDFGIAARALISEQGKRAEVLQVPGGLRQLCVAMPAMADLVRFAVSSEYASARWDDRVSVPPPPMTQGGRRVSRF